MQIVTVRGLWYVIVVNVITTTVLLTIPFLHRFGRLVAPLTLTLTCYVTLSVVTWTVGTDAGLQLYFLVSATVIVMVLGIEHMVLASTLVTIGVGLMITLEFTVPGQTGRQPEWALDVGFVVSALSTTVMIVAAISYVLREIERAEEAMENEYERSESLLGNILPASIAARLKNPATTTIADKYDDASVLFADIAGYTEYASQSTPADLVEFLNRLYTEFDVLVDRHGLEKVKTSGDCYMVVSGVPRPRPDHLAALARLALDMVDVIARMTDNDGRAVPLRIGLGVGPVVAGVIGTRRFFYDVWGDAVNVASRMESSGVEGQIQVPQEIYEQLKDTFEFVARGSVEIKGKGVMRTWFLVGERQSSPEQEARPSAPAVLP